MPKIPAPSVVDIEARRRLEEGMLRAHGRDIRGDDREYNALLGLLRIAGNDPEYPKLPMTAWTHTYEEIDRVIHDTFLRWRDRARLLGGNRP